jgi:hypothetical protein
MRPFPDSAPVAVASMELKNVTSGGPAVEFALRHSGDRRRVLLLRIAACLMLAAFPSFGSFIKLGSTSRLRQVDCNQSQPKREPEELHRSILANWTRKHRAEAQAGEGETKAL